MKFVLFTQNEIKMEVSTFVALHSSHPSTMYKITNCVLPDHETVNQNVHVALLQNSEYAHENSTIFPTTLKNKFTCLKSFIRARTSLVAQNLPVMQETWVQSLDWEDLLEKGMATHSSILAWRILWTEEPGGLLSIASHRVGRD